MTVHGTESDAKIHEKMGFTEGWGICLDPLAAYIKDGMKELSGAKHA